MMIETLFVTGILLFGSSGNSQIESVIQAAPKDSTETEMIVRTEDMFWQSDWTFFSTDRISYSVNSGLYGYYGPQPKYLLDGVPVDPVFFGIHFPQLLPVPFNQIADLETTSGTGVSEGNSYYSGIFSIRSNPIKEGLSIYSSTQLGHNSNEPGPWIFDSAKVTPNIDRFGQWADAGFTLKAGSWYSKGHVKRLSFLNSNPFVQTRIRNLIGFPELGEWPDGRAESTVGLIETGINNRWVKLRLQGFRSESSDFLFFHPLGREIPSDLNLDQITVDADVSFSSSTGIRTMVQYQEKGTGYRRNRLEEEFKWQQTHQTSRASLYLRTNNINLDVGAEYREVKTDASGVENKDQKYLDLFLDQKTEISSWLTAGSYSAITIHEDKVPVQLRGHLDFNIMKQWTVGFEGNYSELLPEIANPVSEFISNGYNILDRLNINHFVPIEISNTELYSLTNRHEIHFSEQIHTKLDITYLNHLRFNIPFQDARYYLELSTLPGGYFLFPENNGQRLHFSLKTELSWSENFQQSLGFFSTITLDGTPAYTRYWKTIPDYIIRHTSVFTPFPDLEMRLNIEYQTKAVWEEFRRLDGELNRTFNVQFPFQLFRFSDTLSPGVNMDLTFSKWFWNQRLRTVFMLNNLFNRKIQSHPIGSIDGFGYMIRFELRL